MDNNTTLDQLSLQGMIKSSMKAVNSLASTNLGEVIWTNNRPKDLYIKDQSEPEEGKNFPET